MVASTAVTFFKAVLKSAYASAICRAPSATIHAMFEAEKSNSERKGTANKLARTFPMKIAPWLLLGSDFNKTTIKPNKNPLLIPKRLLMREPPATESKKHSTVPLKATGSRK